MSYLSAALPSSIYISSGFIYNSGNSVIYCKTKKKKLFPPKVSFLSCPVLSSKLNVYVGSLGNGGQEERKDEKEQGRICNSIRKLEKHFNAMGNQVPFSCWILHPPKHGTLGDGKH